MWFVERNEEIVVKVEEIAVKILAGVTWTMTLFFKVVSNNEASDSTNPNGVGSTSSISSDSNDKNLVSEAVENAIME